MMTHLCKKLDCETLEWASPAPHQDGDWPTTYTDFQLVENTPRWVTPGARSWPLHQIAANDPDAAAARHSLGRTAPGLSEFLRTLGIIAAAFLFLASCVVLTEEERAEREYELDNRLVLAREEYAVKSAACRSAGGVMQINRSSMYGFHYHDYKLARCVRY